MGGGAVNVNMVTTKSGVQTALSDMLARGKSIESFLNRVTFAQYKQAQLNRWQTENTSEGAPLTKWDALTPKYAKRKLVKCKNMPGNGRALMIASGKLVAAATGASADLLKVVSNNGIQVKIDSSAIKYAPYPGLKRPFMQFGVATEQQMVDDIVEYLMTGKTS